MVARKENGKKNKSEREGKIKTEKNPSPEENGTDKEYRKRSKVGVIIFVVLHAKLSWRQSEVTNSALCRKKLEGK